MKTSEIADYLRRILISSVRFQLGIEKFFVISATLDKRNNIIAIGENSSTKTHPIMKRYSKMTNKVGKIYLHAEISALIRSQRKVEKLLVVRVNHKGEFALSKPCPLCEMAIKDANIHKVYYTTNERSIERL